jgi:hypothetical protein
MALTEGEKAAQAKVLKERADERAFKRQLAERTQPREIAAIRGEGNR